MEGIFDQEPRYQRLLEEFRRVAHTKETTLVETYLLFLQVAGEGFDDRQALFDRFTLSEGKMAVLTLLKASGQSTPSELAAAAGVTPGTITGLLAGLERSGTLALFDQILAERFHHIEVLLSPFTPQEQEQLRALLVKLHQRFLDDSSS
jgi:DNA-binding MarR family transcriptional regulator